MQHACISFYMYLETICMPLIISILWGITAIVTIFFIKMWQSKRQKQFKTAHPSIYLSINPSMHPIPLFKDLQFIQCFKDHREAEAKPSWLWGIPCIPGRQSIAGQTQKQTIIHTQIHTYEQIRLDQINMSLSCARKQERPKKTHTGTGRTSKLCRETPQLAIEFKPRNFLMWFNSSDHCTTVL